MGFLEKLAMLPSLTDPWGFQSNTEAMPSELYVSSSLISGTCFFLKKKKRLAVKNKVSHYTYTSEIKEKQNTQLNLQLMLL